MPKKTREASRKAPAARRPVASKTRGATAPAAAPMPAPAAKPQAAQRAPTYDDLLAIARLIESGSRFSEFRLRSGDIEVEVRRGNAGAAPPPPPVQAAAPAPAVTSHTPAAPPVTHAVPAPADTAALPAGTQVVKSPMVGTFYRAQDPSSPPFVEVGSRVEPDTIVCIIEVMKLMNSITAGVSGVVTHILAENAQPVELGQALIAIRPE